jgi:hypothetical protein
MSADAKVLTVLAWIAMATLAIAIARQLSEQKALTIIGQPLREYFESASPKQLEEPDVLLTLQPASGPGNLSAKTCFATDFVAQNQKVGDYAQKTNNFKHGNPDSCSSPRTEFVNSIYKV